jgi:hypothetical protein
MQKKGLRSRGVRKAEGNGKNGYLQGETDPLIAMESGDELLPRGVAVRYLKRSHEIQYFGDRSPKIYAGMEFLQVKITRTSFRGGSLRPRGPKDADALHITHFINM